MLVQLRDERTVANIVETGIGMKGVQACLIDDRMMNDLVVNGTLDDCMGHGINWTAAYIVCLERLFGSARSWRSLFGGWVSRRHQCFSLVHWYILIHTLYVCSNCTLVSG